MPLEPLTTAPLIVQIHVLGAGAAFLLGIAQIIGPKGTAAHKVLGALWIALMALIAGSSLFITHPVSPGDPFWAQFSPIHGFSIATFVSLAIGISLLARGGRTLRGHAGPFVGIFWGGLILAGALAVLLPGRIMHQVVFGG